MTPESSVELRITVHTVFLKKKKKPIYFWPCWVFDVAHRISLGAVNRGYSLAVVLLIAVASFVEHVL